METQDRVQNVDIRLHSSIRHPGQDEETHDMSLAGQLIVKKGKTYLKYEEQQSGNRILTTIKMGTEDALILRSGAVTMRLPLDVGAERTGTYGSGPATFDLLVKTDLLDFDGDADGLGGRFDIAYGLHADGALLGTYKLTITYTEGTI